MALEMFRADDGSCSNSQRKSNEWNRCAAVYMFYKAFISIKTWTNMAKEEISLHKRKIRVLWMHLILCIQRLALQYLYLIISISAVGMTFIHISNVCVPRVYYKNFFLCLQVGNFLQLLEGGLHLDPTMYFFSIC